ncbi:DUF4124 domain-containing protein [Pseudoduganella sp. FT93W]|uniref:DUF4124 domain-containing protein n=2 Tax=Duganella fentianensis TaxID=2692177 RepID=A0A845HX64_9BURK|nr:DUF4124 domain-containing protein [Duganella fentianensis]
MIQTSIPWRHQALAVLGGLCLLGGALPASAQYMWLDEKGVKQLSDRPPPPNIPDKRILKAPGKTSFNPDAAPAEEAAPAQASTPTLAERNAEFNRRQTEARQAAGKAADEARQRAAIAANCEIARKNQQALNDGIRIATYDKNGERSFMTDAERVEQEKNNRKVLANCK